MNTISKFLAAAAFTAAIATPAAAEQLRFERDGESYVANVTTEAGLTRIVGKSLTTGKRFDLALRDDKVTGHYGAALVSFSAPSPSTNLASR